MVTSPSFYRLVVKRECVRENVPQYVGDTIRTPSVVAEIGQRLLGDEDQECFLAFFLNVKNRIVAYSEIGRGSIEQCPIYARDVFRAALLTAGCVAIIVMHNHPSGDPAPSTDDMRLTRHLADIGKVLGLSILDHVIVTDSSSYSFAQAGLLGSLSERRERSTGGRAPALEP